MSIDFSLKGKIALVTGASYGIGFAIASGMAKAGATIVFNDLQTRVLQLTKKLVSTLTVMFVTFVTKKL